MIINKEKRLTFEYDINKSNINKEKHGIDFEDAKKLFYDTNAIMYPSKYINEERFYVTGLINNKFYTSIITFRGENIRIISTRRARKKEIEQYERLRDENNNG